MKIETSIRDHFEAADARQEAVAWAEIEAKAEWATAVAGVSAPRRTGVVWVALGAAALTLVLVGLIPLLTWGTDSQLADTNVSTTAAATTATREPEPAATVPTSAVPPTTLSDVPVPPPSSEDIAVQGIVQSARQRLDPLPTGGTSIYLVAQTHDFDNSTISRLHVVRADTSTSNVVMGVIGDVQVGWSRAGPDVVDMAASRDTLWVAWTEAVDPDGDGDLESGDPILLAVDDETLEVDQLFRVPSDEDEVRLNPDGVRVEVSGQNVWLLTGDGLWVTTTDAVGAPIQVTVPTMPTGLQPFGGGQNFDLWAVAGGGVVIGSSDTGYQMFSADGESQWTRTDSALAIAATEAYTMTDDGKLTVLDPLSGSIQRTMHTGIDDVDSIYCCINNSIHVTSVDGDEDDSWFVFSLVDPNTGVTVSEDWLTDQGQATRWAVAIDGTLYYPPGIIYDPETNTTTGNPFGTDPDLHPSLATVRPAD